jgi:hypothetical protein
MKTTPVGLSLGIVCVLVCSEAAAQEVAEAAADRRRLDVDLRTYVGWAYEPHSLTSGFLGAEVGLRVNPFFEMAVDGAWYAPFNPGTASSTPVNEDRYSCDLDFVVYLLAALTLRNEEAGTIEPYVLGGLGVLVDRPVSVVAPGYRDFGDQGLVEFVTGIGARMFVTRRFTVRLDVRDMVYFDRRESTRIPHGSTSLPITDPENPLDPATWYDPSSYFTNDLQVRLGASLVLGR